MNRDFAGIFPRSWLYVPGHQEDRVGKAFCSEAEAVIVDLEDGVPHDQQEEAMQTLWSLREEAFAREKPWYVRVQSRNQEMLYLKNIRAAVDGGATGIVLPKVESPEEIQDVVSRCQQAGRDLGIIPLVETPRGLLQARAIAEASEQVSALMLGAEDLTLRLGPFTGVEKSSQATLYARWMLALSAAAAGVPAIDKVCLEVRESEPLLAECREACDLGFSGKTIIHPAQIEGVHATFRPSADQVAWAQQVIEAVQEAEKSGRTAILVEGQLVDPPIRDRAKRIVDLNTKLTK